jgi:anthranilate phosphoribosyltransferase
MKRAIQKVIDKVDLSQKEVADVIMLIIKGQASAAQLASFLTALRLKGEVLTEITGLAKVLKKNSIKISGLPNNIVDCCGTGGDLIDTFNVSTIAAFVAAGADVVVAKHTARAVNSLCGSADVLEKLGVAVELSPVGVKKCIEKVGIGFMFAPAYNPVLAKVDNVCREIGIRTIFNLLIPLVNPVGVNGQVLGVYDEKLTSLAAGVLRNLGVKTAYVVHGLEGLDEISICGPTRVSELRKGMINTYTIAPENFGLETSSLNALLGGTATENAQIVKAILSGREHSARTDMVLLNAAALIAAGNKAKDLKTGFELARRSLYNGKAKDKLEKLAKISCELALKDRKRLRTKPV